MAIIPIIRCRHIAASIEFYTKVLDFECWERAESDPGFATLARQGSLVYLSSFGDGAFGQALVVTSDDVESLFRKLVARGLKPPTRPESPVHEAPVDQTWGLREFYVDDPDGNTVRFTER